MIQIFKSIPTADVSGDRVETRAEHCRLMWLSVIGRALLDAEWTADGNNDATGRRRGPQSDAARAWLRGKTQDFRQVCEMAGIDPDFLSSNYNSGRIDMDVFASGPGRYRTKRDVE